MLLDTHVFLWWLFDDPNLSKRIRKILGDIGNPVFVSSASVWEIATKYRLGKLPAASSVAENVPYWITKAGFKPLAISPEHAQLSGSWDVEHRDPFDRMLAAQAKLENLRLISVDKIFSIFPIKTIR
ncbi:MAG: type II toxin-antitoxin system VapC family toxin [Proteobacteria bacterium]|nr:type II toxin-antitoxin system VapC family toxin [Pseudomonadota bacterium]